MVFLETSTGAGTEPTDLGKLEIAGQKGILCMSRNGSAVRRETFLMSLHVVVTYCVSQDSLDTAGGRYTESTVLCCKSARRQGGATRAQFCVARIHL